MRLRRHCRMAASPPRGLPPRIRLRTPFSWTLRAGISKHGQLMEQEIPIKTLGLIKQSNSQVRLDSPARMQRTTRLTTPPSIISQERLRSPRRRSTLTSSRRRRLTKSMTAPLPSLIRICSSPSRTSNWISQRLLRRSHRWDSARPFKMARSCGMTTMRWIPSTSQT